MATKAVMQAVKVLEEAAKVLPATYDDKVPAEVLSHLRDLVRDRINEALAFLGK